LRFLKRPSQKAMFKRWSARSKQTVSQHSLRAESVHGAHRSLVRDGISGGDVHYDLGEGRLTPVEIGLALNARECRRQESVTLTAGVGQAGPCCTRPAVTSGDLCWNAGSG
jgi:hypothetical protein